MPHALGVYREEEFSPGKVEADAAILDTVLAHLAGYGMITCAVGAGEFIRGGTPQSDLVLAMCQSQAALERLSACEAAGALVINRSRAIRSCYRDRMGPVLARAGVPVPRGALVRTTGAIGERIGGLDPRRGIYVKRGDLHALSADDVCRVDDEDALRAALRDFAARGVSMAYLQAAVEGRVVKFYGVTGTSYFSVAESGDAPGDALAARLVLAAQDAAAALGLEVWGGDAILNDEQFIIVDFNDWPSFERVREPAGAAIANRVNHLLHRKLQSETGNEGEKPNPNRPISNRANPNRD